MSPLKDFQRGVGAAAASREEVLASNSGPETNNPREPVGPWGPDASGPRTSPRPRKAQQHSPDTKNSVALSARMKEGYRKVIFAFLNVLVTFQTCRECSSSARNTQTPVSRGQQASSRVLSSVPSLSFTGDPCFSLAAPEPPPLTRDEEGDREDKVLFPGVRQEVGEGQEGETQEQREKEGTDHENATEQEAVCIGEGEGRKAGSARWGTLLPACEPPE